MSDKTELSDGQVATLQHEVVQELRNIDLSVSAMESRLCNMEAAIANGFNKITISEGIHLAVKQLLADSTAREYVVQILDRAIKQVVEAQTVLYRMVESQATSHVNEMKKLMEEQLEQLRSDFGQRVEMLSDVISDVADEMESCTKSADVIELIRSSKELVQEVTGESGNESEN